MDKNMWKECKQNDIKIDYQREILKFDSDTFRQQRSGLGKAYPSFLSFFGIKLYLGN